MTASAAQRTPNPNYVEAGEWDKRREEGLCVKCGAPDHKMRECHNGWSKTRLSANKGKKEEPKKETAKIAEVEEEESEGSGKE